MGEFILEVAENGRHLCIQRGSVAVQEGKKTLGLVPSDSLACVLLSADGLSLSRHFLAVMAELGVPVIVCGKNYLPVSMCLPYARHYLALGVAETQMKASPVLKKKLWQMCAAAKIRNQAHVLHTRRRESAEAEKLRRMAKSVRSGDGDNREAQAARLYWPALMGRGFIREPDGGGVNAALNYGYAIVRAACARALCAAGLLPLFGIHHHNLSNPFCLADDIMEPLRPFVDALVFDLMQEDENTGLLLPAQKKRLSTIQRSPLPFMGEEHTLASVTTRMAQGLAQSFAAASPLLPLPG